MVEENKDQKERQDKANSQENEEEKKQESASEQKQVPESEYLELKERLLRLAAEFDNYKKRVAKEIENAKTLGKAELMKKLLPTIDEFELALSVSKESKEIKGFQMIYSNFIDSLKSEGLSEIETNGKYDPYKHEIILTRESKEKEGTIIEVVRKGYMLNDILLRPATVIVAKNKESNEKEDKKQG
jgi:molecular chaperone GrpE